MTEKGGTQAYESSKEFPAAFVQRQWDRRQYITDIAYNQREWLVVTSSMPYSEQRYYGSQKFPSTWVEQQWKDGFDITKVAYAGNRWMVVMSKGAGLSRESWVKYNNFEDIQGFIRDKWNDGRAIVDLAYGNGEWVAVLAQGVPYGQQVYQRSSKFPVDWINQQYQKGKQISSVAYGEGKWVVVMSNYNNRKAERYAVNSTLPKDFIQKNYDSGRKITSILFNYERSLTKSFDTYYQAGLAAAKGKDYDVAIYNYTEALKINPRHAGAYNNRAWAKFKNGNCLGGVNDATRSIEITPTAYNYHTRGVLYNCLGRCHESSEDLTKALSLARSNMNKAPFYASRAEAKACLGMSSDAVADYNRAIAANPSNRAEYQRALAQVQRNKAERPTITWDYPFNAFVSSTEDTYRVKACISAEEDIRSMKLSVNGRSFAMRGFGVASDCSASIDQQVKLRPGSNELVIEVETASAKVVSEKRVIEYKASTGGNYHALLIGVQNYDDFSIDDLNEPIGDCQELAATLVNDYTFERGNVHLLKNPDKDAIINKLIYLQERLSDEDKLLIFYSGHGIVKNEIGYWLPADADKNSRSKWFSNAELRDYVNSINTQHTLVIADACFSGSIFTGGYRNVTEFACAEMERIPSRRAMTSGANTVVPDNSIFFEYLIKKLKENNSSCLSAETLYSKVKPAVIYNSPNNHIPQFGVMPQTGDEGGNFIFRRR
jgi:tetratricopeptide (TPR) repeat protein